MTKKVYKQNIRIYIWNVNQEFSYFKKMELGLKVKKKLVLWEFNEKSDFYGGWRFTKKLIYRGDCLYTVGAGQFADLRGGLVKKRGWYFWGEGGNSPIHTILNMGSMLKSLTLKLMNRDISNVG